MTQFWLWVAFIGMVIGSVYFGFKASAMRRKEGMEFPLESFFITLYLSWTNKSIDRHVLFGR